MPRLWQRRAVSTCSAFCIKLGGLLSGSGTLTGSLTNAAQLDLGRGNATDMLSITGSYTQTAAGRLYVEVGGSLTCTAFDLWP